MAKTNELIAKVLEEITTVLHKIDEQQIAQFTELIAHSKRIFVLGTGRSGLVAKSFAMRLMQLGYTVYVIGETITPAVESGDLLVSVSGSGKTANILDLSTKARSIGAKVAAVTSDSQSPITKVTDTFLIVPGATKNGNGIKSVQLLSTLFDQGVQIILDVVCSKLSLENNVSNLEAKERHSNME